MVWKQDLAKLKAQLREEPAPPQKKVAPKPTEATPRSMEEEDDLFLAMMGRKKAATPPARKGGEEAPAPRETAPEAPAPADFQSAVAGLKGLKRLGGDPLLSQTQNQAQDRGQIPAQAPTQAEGPGAAREAPAPEALAPAPASEPLPEGESEAVRPGLPQRIQLAAGMAIDVDGSLDLKGHSLQDALERVKDRVADAQNLHWRSLLVNLGPGPELHEGFLTLVAAGGLAGVARFAQAPIPMGGAQAWVLYLMP